MSPKPVIAAAFLFAGLLSQSAADETKPSITLPGGPTLVFKRFTQGDPLPENPMAPGKKFEHPDLRHGSSDLKRKTSWSTRYLMAFEVQSAGNLDDWTVFALDDDGYTCEVQPFYQPDNEVVWFQDPLPVGSRNITLRFKPRDVANVREAAKELVIANPFFVIPSVLKGETLPQTRECFGAQVKLTKVVRRKNGTPLEIEYLVSKDGSQFYGVECPKIRIEDGFGLKYQSGDWGMHSIVGGNSIGIENMVPWRASLAWKLQLHMRRSRRAEVFPNEECYKVSRLDRSTGKGSGIEPGSPTLAPVTAELKDGKVLVIGWERGWDSDSELVLLKVSDDQAREIRSGSSEFHGQVVAWPRRGTTGRMHFDTKFTLDVKPDAKWLSVSFAIETPQLLEFVVTPKFVDD